VKHICELYLIIALELCGDREVTNTTDSKVCGAPKLPPCEDNVRERDVCVAQDGLALCTPYPLIYKPA
jgi:hypothetical protein